MRKPIPTCTFNSDAESPQTFNVTGSGSGWEVITLNNFSLAAWKGYIDLSGYTREDRTWFTRAVQVQGQNYLDATTTGIITVHDIITDEPMTDEDLIWAFYLNTPGLEVAGTIDMQNIVYGRVRTWGPRNWNAAGEPVVGALTQLNQQMFNEDFYGTNDGSAGEKLHCYRVVWFAPAAGVAQTVYMGPSQFVLSGAVDKESDLEYIMRLKRAYETAGPFS